jgi:hypothetical protein
MCSVLDVALMMSEMRRVLKPGGRLLFVEHGLAPQPRVQWWQDRLTPAWKRFSGGCHLNRAIVTLIESGGFHIEQVDNGYMSGPKPMTYISEGSARPPAGASVLVTPPQRRNIDDACSLNRH